VNAARAWQDLLSLALIGSDRRSPAPLQMEGPLGELIAHLDPTDPPRYVLGAAGAIAAYRQAGFQPPTVAPPPLEPCPPETRARCSPEAARLLALLLDTPELLPEWLHLARDRGERVPESLLPELLECARMRANLREALLPVLGERGRWLAALNPTWRYACPEDPNTCEQRWQFGTRSERLQVLRTVRDRDPAGARDLLATTWSAEPADFRATVLEVLAHRLGPDDEPWLKAALGDRSKQVRLVAAALLARLPDSAYSQRMRARAEACLEIAEGEVRVQLPEAIAPDWERDGIVAKPPRGMGAKAWWLQQLVAAVPPSHWSARAAPEAILAGTPDSWRAVLFAAWAAAIATHAAPDWAEALLRAVSDSTEAARAAWLPSVIAVVPRDRQQQFALDGLELPRPLENGVLVALLARADAPWRLDLCRKFLEIWRRDVVPRKARHPYASELQAAIANLGLVAPPELASEIDALLAGVSGARWGGACTRLRDRLDLRQHLHRAFADLRSANQ